MRVSAVAELELDESGSELRAERGQRHEVKLWALSTLTLSGICSAGTSPDVSWLSRFGQEETPGSAARASSIADLNLPHFVLCTVYRNVLLHSPQYRKPAKHLPIEVAQSAQLRFLAASPPQCRPMLSWVRLHAQFMATVCTKMDRPSGHPCRE